MQFHDAVFSEQDSLGRKSFAAFAKKAGVSDLDGFTKCADSQLMDSIIDRDAATAERLGAMGTPAVIVNGILFGGAPTEPVLDSIAHAIVTKEAAVK